MHRAARKLPGMTTQPTWLASLGLLVLRIAAGGYMMTHGWGKVRMVLAGEWEKFGDPIGLGKAPSLVAAAGAEFVCALLVVIGLATRFAALPVAFTMGVAAFVVHGNDPWTAGAGAQLFRSGAAQSWASREPALLFLAAFLTLACTGPGRIALDALLWRRRGGAEPDSGGQGVPAPGSP